MSRDSLAFLIFILVPFIFSALAEFAPMWIWMPAALVLGVLWLGAIECLKK